MKYIDKDIEKVLHVFEEYLTEEPNLDIQQTKYGYFAIVRVEKKNEKYLWDKLENSADVFRYIFNFMIEKYIEALSNLDNQESGELIIDDMDSDSYLIFEKHKYGQMEISGRLGCTFRDNYLIFKFPADQTIIRNLIDRLKCYMKS